MEPPADVDDEPTNVFRYPPYEIFRVPCCNYALILNLAPRMFRGLGFAFMGFRASRVFLSDANLLLVYIGAGFPVLPFWACVYFLVVPIRAQRVFTSVP